MTLTKCQPLSESLSHESVLLSHRAYAIRTIKLMGHKSLKAIRVLGNSNLVGSHSLAQQFVLTVPTDEVRLILNKQTLQWCSSKGSRFFPSSSFKIVVRLYKKIVQPKGIINQRNILLVGLHIVRYGENMRARFGENTIDISYCYYKSLHIQNIHWMKTT